MPQQEFNLTPASGIPLAQQIRQYYSRSIASGKLHAGDLLPAVRALAGQLGVNVNTVRQAYSRLERDGLVKTSQGVGTQVLDLDPNRLLRMARAETTNSVGLILPDLGNPFYYPFLQGVESVAHQDQTLLLVCNTHDDQRDMLRSFAQLSAQHIDGIIAAACNLCDFLPSAAGRNAALPLVTADWPECSGYSVQMDLANAGYLATRHLIDHGHRRIGLITVDRLPVNVRPVNDGYERALHSARLQVEPSLITRIGTWDMESGRQAAERLIGLPQPPTAIFAIADMLALGAMEAVQRAGLRIPQDLALTSFNDITFAALVKPALTTVAAPTYELGRQAMRMLNALRAGKIPARKRITLPTSLVIRESCGEHGQPSR